VQALVNHPELQAKMNHYTLTPEEMLSSGTGKSVYEMLGGNAQASDLLKAQGVPGIRYLDGGSRSAGQGSSNFVTFDPEMIRILERNGQPTGLMPWNPGEYQGLLSP
jgi:hypothetical protein